MSDPIAPPALLAEHGLIATVVEHALVQRVRPYPGPITWTWRQTRQLVRRGERPAAVPAAPSAATADGRPTRPDKLSIWPVEEERFGVDVLYVGAQGFRRADVVHRQLVAAGVDARLIQQGDVDWVVRFGPVSREDMLVVLNGYVW